MQELSLLLATAASIGVVHTLLGPDHYVPFAALSAARGWSTRRTLALTAACGVGHVLGSLVLGAAGVLLGASLADLVGVEGLRGEVAAWLLLGIGAAYLVWGVAGARRGHAHPRGDGAGRDLAPWALFIVFVFGPCEALIPLLMVPAIEHRWLALGAVAAVFAGTTIATMLLAVWLLRRGVAGVGAASWARYGHPAAGAAICACALAMLVLGA